MQDHGVAAERLHTELNPFRQPMDLAAQISGGALDTPWVANHLVTRVAFHAEASG